MANMLFFDTESTGVPRNYKAPSSDTDNWPRLVQLSWINTDNSGNELSRHDFIIRPVGFTIPAEATSIHGISTERALRDGTDLRIALRQFMADFNMASTIVGHNVAFDKKVVGAELVRLGAADVIDAKATICTMQAATNYCRIPGPYGYKWPKLQELHQKLFGYQFEDAHNSMADVEATCHCFWRMRQLGLL